MKVGLFVPCYVDALYPEAGVATYKLLKHYGLDVGYPEKQTCCGQPMANAGFQDKSEKVIETFDELFKDYDYIVAPSASCAAYVKVYYPKILEGKHECVSSKKIMDVVEFLHDVLKVDHVPGKFPHEVSVHNSCHGVRELGLSSPSERHIKPFNKIIDLLNMVEGITVHEPERKDECCGFGGMFSIEEPAVSTHPPAQHQAPPRLGARQEKDGERYRMAQSQGIQSVFMESLCSRHPFVQLSWFCRG